MGEKNERSKIKIPDATEMINMMNYKGWITMGAAALGITAASCNLEEIKYHDIFMAPSIRHKPADSDTLKAYAMCAVPTEGEREAFVNSTVLRNERYVVIPIESEFTRRLELVPVRVVGDGSNDDFAKIYPGIEIELPAVGNIQNCLNPKIGKRLLVD